MLDDRNGPFFGYPSHLGNAQPGDNVGVAAERAFTNDRIIRIAVNIEYGGEVHVEACR
ncbi:hypothetical protein D3C79_1061790 [compost metagenome]